MEGVNIECTKDENKITHYRLSKEVHESFCSVLKQGVYKELHKRRLLTDAQLNALLSEKQS